jgi:hypothetical protein
MEIARVFPVKSKKDLVAFAKAIDEWPAEKKADFSARFGRSHERWYFQKLGRKAYVISVAEVERPEGFADFAATDDEFTKWFLKRAKKLTGWSFKKRPMGPPSELIYELKA